MVEPGQLEKFRREGFLDGGPVLGDSELKTLREQLEQAASPRWPEGTPPQIWRCLNMWQICPAFAALTSDPRIAASVVALAGAQSLRLWHDDVRRVNAGQADVSGWRQEGPHWSVLEPMSQVSAWVAINSGARFRFIRGSHERGTIAVPDGGRLPSNIDGARVEQSTVALPAGHVLYVHSMTLRWLDHASKDSAPSWLAAVHYMTEKTHYVAAGEHRLKPLIEVDDGETVTGRQFPLVWSKGRLRGS